eukprot:s333_g4.t1
MSHDLEVLPGRRTHPNIPVEYVIPCEYSLVFAREFRNLVTISGDLWTFGRAHAVLRHAQQEAKEGDARHVARVVEDWIFFFPLLGNEFQGIILGLWATAAQDFCLEHQLDRRVIAPDEVLAAAVKAAAAAQHLALRPASSREALLVRTPQLLRPNVGSVCLQKWVCLTVSSSV